MTTFAGALWRLAAIANRPIWHGKRCRNLTLLFGLVFRPAPLLGSANLGASFSGQLETRTTTAFAPASGRRHAHAGSEFPGSFLNLRDKRSALGVERIELINEGNERGLSASRGHVASLSYVTNHEDAARATVLMWQKATTRQTCRKAVSYPVK